MSPTSPPTPTPATDRTLPAPAPIPRRSGSRRWAPGVATALAAFVLVGGRVLWQVERLRSQASTVRPVEHDVDLRGAFPPRWLVVLGDSAVAGHGLVSAEVALPRLLGRALVARDGRATAVRSVAEDGARTVDVLTHQIDAVDGAEVVVVGAGVNDVLRRVEPATVVAALRDLVAEVRARAIADVRIVLIACPDLSAAPGVPWPVRRWLGRRCRLLARAQTAAAAELGVPVVCPDREMLTRQLFGPDGVHPGELGHRRLAESVLDRFEDS